MQQIDRVVEEAQISESSRKRIGKARRLIESFVATIAFFHLSVQMWISELRLTAELEQVVLKELIPALYLQRAAKKLPTAEANALVMAVYQPMLERIRGPGEVLSKLPAEDRAKVERVAEACSRSVSAFEFLCGRSEWTTIAPASQFASAERWQAGCLDRSPQLLPDAEGWDDGSGAILWN